jgi:hypothetical protein
MGYLIAYLAGIITAINPKNQNRRNYTCTSDSEHPLAVRVIPNSLPKEELTKAKEKDRREKGKYTVEKWTLFVLCIYAGFTILIWCSMRTANKIAHDSLVVSQRPWVSITNVAIENMPRFAARANGQVEISLDFSGTLKNVGLSAATKSQVEWTIVPVDKPGFPKEPMPCPTPIRNNRVEFGADAIFLMPHDEIPSKSTPSIVDTRIKTIWSIWAQACIPYQDIFGNAYQTKLIYHSITRDDSIPILAVQGRDLTYKPIIGWNLWSTGVEP